jgi:cellulose biosynthesis protein BcsQ
LAVVDAGPWPSPLLDQALALADLVLVVLLADAASFATLPALRSLLRSRRGHRSGDLGARVLVNCADSTRLGRDVRALLSAQPELALLEHAIHRDTSVPEALALQRPIIVASPTSQAAEDFERVALWTLDELDAGRDARPPQASRGEPITVADVSSANGASR